ncbi:MAG: hypothetical protein R2843_01075 [Thermomicrobiales bacterium]
MMHFGTSRRRCLYGAATASLIALYPGARVVWAQNGAAYDLIDLGPFDVSVPVESGYSITGCQPDQGRSANRATCAGALRSQTSDSRRRSGPPRPA